jgi:hypothetical protein
MSLYTTFAAAAFAALAATTPACPNCKQDYVFGPGVPIGNGMAFSWVRMDAERKHPLEIGLTLTETALEGLPTELEGDMEAMEVRLDLPPSIKGKPFDHIGLDWVPKGHIPIGVYDIPHFDIHFYTFTPEQRSKITLVDGDLEVCRREPPAGVIPAGYILPPDVEIPNMGAHWIDPTFPELNGQRFTHTFLYGSYDGRLAFLEPMITLEFLKTKPDIEVPIKQPTVFQYSGYYPAKYKISYNAERKEYSISLVDLTYRAAN